MRVTHLLFAYDTFIFCKATTYEVLFLSWVLLVFEASSRLKINLEKSFVYPVGVVGIADRLARELGCNLASLPSSYLGLPLGKPNQTL